MPSVNSYISIRLSVKCIFSVYSALLGRMSSWLINDKLPIIVMLFYKRWIVLTVCVNVACSKAMLPYPLVIVCVVFLSFVKIYVICLLFGSIYISTLCVYIKEHASFGILGTVLKSSVWNLIRLSVVVVFVQCFRNVINRAGMIALTN